MPAPIKIVYVDDEAIEMTEAPNLGIDAPEAGVALAEKRKLVAENADGTWSFVDEVPLEGRYTHVPNFVYG